MSSKNSRLAFTTDPELAKRLRETQARQTSTDEDPGKQSIRISIDRKQRSGKAVTLASGFRLTSSSLARIAVDLRRRCGAGGTSREGEIEIQGEHLDTVSEVLSALGFKTRKL